MATVGRRNRNAFVRHIKLQIESNTMEMTIGYAYNMGFCASGAGRSYNQQQCIPQLWFGQDKQHWALVLTIIFCTFAQQRYRADSWLIPHLHKALFVICNAATPHIRTSWRLDVQSISLSATIAYHPEYTCTLFRQFL